MSRRACRAFRIRPLPKASLGLLVLGAIAATASYVQAEEGFLYRYAGLGQTVAGSTSDLAIDAPLHHPIEVFVDPTGNLFITGRPYGPIWRVGLDGRIATVAGGGSLVEGADGGPATQAFLDAARGLAVDAAGNLFIAEMGKHRVRKVDPSGIISTVAGTGSAGYGGDGGPATAALLNVPIDVAVDGSGNLYISEEANHRIRKVDASGTITTIAGTGVAGFSGDTGAATAAQICSPRGLAWSAAGELFFADGCNERVRKIDPSGIVTTVAGTGNRGWLGDGGPALAADLAHLQGLAVDGAGNLFIAMSEGYNRIRKVDATGTISLVLGGDLFIREEGIPATLGSFDHVYGVAVDAFGNFYATDYFGGRVVKVIGDGPCGNGTLDAGETCDDGNATSGDCCSATCQLDPIGTACDDDVDLCTEDVCDGAGACTRPFLPDADGDGDCDEQDPCASEGSQTFLTAPASTLKVVVSPTSLFDVRGTLVLPPGSSFADLRPDLRGAEVVVDQGERLNRSRLALPPGTFSPVTRVGWRLSKSGKRWLFRDQRRPHEAGLLRSLSITDRDRSATPGQARVIAKGPFWVEPPAPGGLHITLRLGDHGDALAGRCGEVTYFSPDCNVRTSFSKFVIDCRR